MTFTDITFLGRFLPVFLIIYYLIPQKYKDHVLFLGSIIFYAYGDKRATILLLSLTVINFFLGKVLVAPRGITEKTIPTVDKIVKAQFEAPTRRTKKSAARKVALIAAIILDAGTLTAFKIITYHSTTMGLPLGLSFYIFKMISYQADLYTGYIKLRPSFIRTAVYFTMFPQIAEGPIMRYSDGDFDKPHGRVITLKKIENGAVLICLGIGMKVLLADRIGILWNEISKMGYENISTPLAWAGAFAYTFQLYFDFWGYSLMASGLGMLLGFNDIVNFDHPYASQSVSEFYRRWHATLGEWFKNYIYFPLGGSRRSKPRTILNLMIVWAITGLWHGGDINFLLWGLILGLIIVMEKFVSKPLLEKAPIIGRLHVLILIPLTWVIFAISDLRELGIYFARLFPFFGIGKTLMKTDIITYLATYWPYFLAGAVLLVPGVFKFILKHRKNPLIIICLAILFWISVYYSVGQTGNAFMYFSF